MRIKITLASEKSGCIDFNYQHQIQAILYSFLARSDPDYATWLHEQGFVYKNDKRFKLFVFSGIIFHGPIKIKSSSRSNRFNRLNSLNSLSGLSGFSFDASPNNPFTLSFQIASPVDKFIQHLVDGIFKEGSEIRLGRQSLNVYRVETLPDSLENIGSNSSNGLNGLSGLNGLNLKPLESPIFVKKPMPSGQKDKYLFPGDEEYKELLNQNLIHKYETLYGKAYEGEPLKFNFQFEQLERLKRFNRFEPKLLKSFKVFKDGIIVGEIKGSLQPFTVSGSIELIRIGLDCGFGQNNSMGCGYVETVQAA